MFRESVILLKSEDDSFYFKVKWINRADLLWVECIIYPSTALILVHNLMNRGCQECARPCHMPWRWLGKWRQKENVLKLQRSWSSFLGVREEAQLAHVREQWRMVTNKPENVGCYWAVVATAKRYWGIGEAILEEGKGSLCSCFICLKEDGCVLWWSLLLNGIREGKLDKGGGRTRSLRK